MYSIVAGSIYAHHITVFQCLLGLCRDHVGSQYRRGASYYRQNFAVSGAAENSAADIVLVVDESGSIDMKVLWIREVCLSHTRHAHTHTHTHTHTRTHAHTHTHVRMHAHAHAHTHAHMHTHTHTHTHTHARTYTHKWCLLLRHNDSTYLAYLCQSMCTHTTLS